MKQITITTGSGLTKREIQCFEHENDEELLEIIDHEAKRRNADIESDEILGSLFPYEKRAIEILTKCDLPVGQFIREDNREKRARNYWFGEDGLLYPIAITDKSLCGSNTIYWGFDKADTLFWMEYDVLCSITPDNGGNITLSRKDCHWPTIPDAWKSEKESKTPLISSFNWMDHSIEDSPTWLASNIRAYGHSIRQCLRKNQLGNAIALAFAVGEMAERLFWKVDHEEAALKGYARREHEHKAQVEGAKANSKKRRDNINDLAKQVNELFGKNTIAALNDSQIAGKLIKKGRTESERTLRNYLKEARDMELIPSKLEK